jgi:hypothetical protein
MSTLNIFLKAEGGVFNLLCMVTPSDSAGMTESLRRRFCIVSTVVLTVLGDMGYGVFIMGGNSMAVAVAVW